MRGFPSLGHGFDPRSPLPFEIVKILAKLAEFEGFSGARRSPEPVCNCLKVPKSGGRKLPAKLPAVSPDETSQLLKLTASTQ